MEKEMINRLKIALAEEKKQQVTGRATGKDRAFVSRWVTNTMQPDARNFLRIAEA